LQQKTSVLFLAAFAGRGTWPSGGAPMVSSDRLYLMGLYFSGWPSQREYLTARCTGVSLLKTWAYDHICLFGWTLPLPTEASRP
jgi:hypothetical protein